MSQISNLPPIELAIQMCEGQDSLAKRLGLKSQGTVSQWVTGRRPVPSKHCRKIEELTKGKVTRYDLRPDIFGKDPQKAA